MRVFPWLAGVLLAAGCASSLTGPRPVAVEAHEFAAVPATPSPASPLPDRPALPIGQGVTITTPAAASEGLERLTASPGPPPAAENPPAPLAREFLDAKVGDINGKPVFAADFLDELGPRLTARARELVARRAPAEARSAWRREATQAIGEKLEGLLRDELLRAEALASLTPEQRQGLRAFMDNLRGDVLSRYRGSRAEANQQILGTQGMTLDEYLRQQEQATLIQYQVQNQIRRRVHVSWRDIVREYERRPEVFRPPPQARFRLIQIDAGDDEARLAVERALAEGRPFAEVASQPLNRHKPAEGGLETRTLQGEFSRGEFFGQPALNDAARALTPGATAGPLRAGNALFWVHLESIRAGDVKSLYDMQLAIEDALKSDRTSRRFVDYIDRLRQRASFTDFDTMLARLVWIAEARCFEPALAASTRRSP